VLKPRRRVARRVWVQRDVGVHGAVKRDALDALVLEDVDDDAPARTNDGGVEHALNRGEVRIVVWQEHRVTQVCVVPPVLVLLRPLLGRKFGPYHDDELVCNRPEGAVVEVEPAAVEHARARCASSRRACARHAQTLTLTLTLPIAGAMPLPVRRVCGRWRAGPRRRRWRGCVHHDCSGNHGSRSSDCRHAGSDAPAHAATDAARDAEEAAQHHANPDLLLVLAGLAR